jgi:hypothetical protein
MSALIPATGDDVREDPCPEATVLVHWEHLDFSNLDDNFGVGKLKHPDRLTVDRYD